MTNEICVECGRIKDIVTRVSSETSDDLGYTHRGVRTFLEKYLFGNRTVLCRYREVYLSLMIVMCSCIFGRKLFKIYAHTFSQSFENPNQFN